MGQTTFKGPVKSENGLILGSSGSTVKGIYTGTVAVNPASIADNDVGEATATITGVAAGDIVVLVPPAATLTAGLMSGASVVTAADTVKVRIVNSSGGAVDEASASWTYIWFDLT